MEVLMLSCMGLTTCSSELFSQHFPLAESALCVYLRWWSDLPILWGEEEEEKEKEEKEGRLFLEVRCVYNT